MYTNIPHDSLKCNLKVLINDTFDFATLYTYIPHDSLKCNLKVLINEAFKVRGAQFLSLNRQGVAYWSVEPTSGFYFSIDKLVEMLEYLIENIYIVVGNRVFQQHIGIHTVRIRIFFPYHSA